MAKFGIIGAGIFGLSSAYWALKEGHEVHVFERNTVGSGASGGLVGALAPYMPDAWHDKKSYQLRALVGAETFWHEVDAESGMESGYGRIGRIQRLNNERGRELAIARIGDVSRHWPEGFLWQVDAEMSYPFFDAPFGFVYDNLSARLHPRQALASLARAVQRRGGEIHEYSPIQDIHDVKNKFDVVIVAAGYHGWQLTRNVFGAGFGQGTKGQALICQPKTEWRYPLVMAENFYVLPHVDGTVAIGSTSETKWDEPGVDEKLDGVWRRAIGMLPDLKDADVLETWAGIRPRCYRPDPIVGALPENERIFVFNGGYKTGFGYAHQISFDLVQHINGKNLKVPEAFTLDSHRRDFTAP